MHAEFDAFPQATLDFLVDLADNNNRAWFEANRGRYEAEWVAPAVAFVATIGSRLQRIDPGIRTDLRTNGSGSLMRIYRDTRFSADKTPYKPSITGMWWTGAGKKNANPAFGFQLAPDGLGLMAGMFGFDKAQLTRYRAAVDAPQSGRALADILADLQGRGYAPAGDRSARVPREFAADHPRGELLRHKGLYAHPVPSLSPAEVTTAGLIDRVMVHFERLAPLQRWLVDHVAG